jgi:predicted amidohydrolase YtcJ
VRDSICRRTASGQEIGPSECITAEQAFPLYTREAAYFSFEEKERGTLKDGKLADLVVLDKDPLKLPPEDIANCQVKMTVVGGRIVYGGQ